MKIGVCLLSGILAFSAVFAQEMEDDDPAAALAAQAEAAMKNDLAGKLAANADAAAKLLPGIPSGEGEVKTAEDAVRANLAKLGVGIGYDRKRHAIIAIGTAEVSAKDPANDPIFLSTRNAKAMQAYLNAKSAVIQAIYSELSATERLEVVGEFGGAKPPAEYVAKRKELETKRAALVKKLGALDKAEAAAFAGVTFGDRLNAILDSLVKKFDTKFGLDKIAAEKRALRDSLKEECAALKAECEALEQQAKKLSPPVPSTAVESRTKILSKMPLLGSSVLTQAESWDELEQVYTVSLAIVWSPRMQESALAQLTGGEAPKMAVGRFTPQEWIQRQTLVTMVGPRRFTDSEGHSVFVGISAVDLTGPVKDRAAKKMLADTNARHYVGVSLAGDLETFTEASSNYKEFDDDNRQSVEKLANLVAAKCEFRMGGCTQLGAVTAKHPITGRTIYVSAYYVDPQLAKEAGSFLKESYEGALHQATAAKKSGTR